MYFPFAAHLYFTKLLKIKYLFGFVIVLGI